MQNALVVGSREGGLEGPGDVIFSKASIFPETGEVFAGTKRPSRSETTIFNSVAIATEDVGRCAARLRLIETYH